MGSLGAHENIFNKIVRGEWAGVLPKKVYQNFSEWCARQRGSEQLSVRFTFCNPEDNSRYAIYILCNPNLGKKVAIKGYKSQKDRPLAMMPSLYEVPLFCMPNNLLESIVEEHSDDE